MTLYGFAIGTTLGNITNLESLTVPIVPPKPTYSPYTSVVDLGDGSVFGKGSPIASWHWDFLPRTMREQLRQYCTGASSNVYIYTYTKDNSGELKLFYATMIWPVTSEEVQTAKAMDFTIQFKHMIASSGVLGETLGALTVVGTGTVA